MKRVEFAINLFIKEVAPGIAPTMTAIIFSTTLFQLVKELKSFGRSTTYFVINS